MVIFFITFLSFNNFFRRIASLYKNPLQIKAKNFLIAFKILRVLL